MNSRDFKNLLTAAREWLRWNWMKVVFILLATFIFGFMTGRARAAEPAPTVNLTYQVGEGNIVTLNWSAPWAASCTASGAWTGAKSPAGSQSVGAVTATRSFGLNCVGAANDDVLLTWEPPTEYSDRTPLPAGAIGGYRVFRGASTSSMTRIADLAGSAREYLFRDLPVGTHFFAVAAVGTDGLQGVEATPGSRVVTVPPAASASVTLRVPGAPTLTVKDPVAYDVRLDGLRFRVARQVGTVPVGTVCHKDFELPGGFYRVERADVQFSQTPGSAVIVARCG